MKNLLLLFLFAFTAHSVMGQAPPDLPIDFDDPTINYELASFGGTAAAVEADPTDPANDVLSIIKAPGSQCWAGTTVGGSCLANPIPFGAGNMIIYMDVYSPATGAPVLLKVEDCGNAGISSEVLVFTTTSGAWETLAFDFASGCGAPPNLANTYNKLSIFPNFACTPDACGNANPGSGVVFTTTPFYFDDISMTPPAPVAPSIPMNFGETTVNYVLEGFGGTSGVIGADPTDPSNPVLCLTDGDQCWSGLTVGGPAPGFCLESPVDFSTGMVITMDVYSPVAGSGILLKVEDCSNPGISTELVVLTTTTNAWETLTFDFSMACPAVNMANTYDKMSIFPQFTCDPYTCGPNPGVAAPFSATSYYFDNIVQINAGPPATVDVTLCVDLNCETGATNAPAVGGTFNNQCAGCDFLSDPDGDGVWCAVVALDPGVQDYRFFYQGAGFETFTTVTPGCTADFNGQIRREITVVANTPVTVTHGWESCDPTCGPPPVFVDVDLCVDLSCITGPINAPAVGGGFNGQCAGCDFLSDPDGDGIWCATVSMAEGVQDYRFFYQEAGFETFTAITPGCTADFTGQIRRTITVVDGMTPMVTSAWESCDAACIPPPELPITFDDPTNFDYNLINFGGIGSGIGVDPLDANNAVVCATKAPGAECWAGTTIGTPCLGSPVPFGAGSMVMTVDVYSPAVGVPFLLKVEVCGNGAISSEVLVLTTVANAWETLVFDFSMGCPAAPNLANSYSVVSVFPNFNCGDYCGMPNPGAGSPLIAAPFYYDNIMMCGLPIANLTCPPTSGLDCTDAIPTAATSEAEFLALGGTIDNPCGADLTVSSSDVSVTSGASVTITRTYTITDGTTTLTCDQTISFNDTSAPVVTCPPATVVDCESVPEALTSIDDFIAGGGTVSDDCAMLADLTLAVAQVTSGDLCPQTVQRVITRTYTITDINSNPSSCSQTITIFNSGTGPIITSVPLNKTIDCAFNAMPELHLFKADTDCNLGLTYSVSEVTANGTPNCPGSNLQYEYTVVDDCGRMATYVQTYTIQNDGPEFVCPVDICVIDCPADTDMIQSTFDNYANLATVISNCSGSISIANNFNPDGFFNQNCNNGPVAVENAVAWQIVTFVATDQCGRQDDCTALVVIKDTTGPAILGEPVNAIRYNNAQAQSEYDNWALAQLSILSADEECNGSTGTVDWDYAPASPNTTVMSGPFAVTEVTFTATDGCGNASSVTATFSLKEEPTSSQVNISGTITDEQNEDIENVSVGLNYNNQGQLSNFMTGADGAFEFEAETGENYEVIPARNDDPLNGITTMDLILISKHILGMEELDSPYKRIAADVNNSGTITGTDLIEIRKLILFITDHFQNNTSWKFIDADYVFPDPTNPFAFTFPTLHSINGLSESMLADFIGVKIGDVNNSAVPNEFASSGDTRSEQQLVFGLTDQELDAGETYVVDFKAKDFKNILGYQFSLNFEQAQLDFVDLKVGNLPALSSDNFGTSNLNDGVITSSWNQQEALSIADETVLFSLTFKAKVDGQLSKALYLNSKLTATEAYNDAVQALELDLAFEGEVGEAATAPFALYQNQPNPFRDNTVIGFNLPEASEATLTIFDMAGRVLVQQTGDFAAGFNQINIEQATFNHVGLMYYTLQTATDSATKKMILISK